MTQQVIVHALPNGTVTVETSGVKGPACEKLSEAIEKALGDQAANTKKAEWFQKPLQAGQAANQGAG